MKMKRMKNEVISATVESYLKRRHYQANDVYQQRKGNQLLFCQNSDQMTLNATAECGTSQENSIVFSAITIDITAADQAYQRLKKWMNVILNEKIRIELQGLLYPIFCHLYLEMLHVGNRQPAVQFLKTHQNDFVSDTEKDFIEELSSVYSVQDIELRPLVNAFRTRKYKVDLSESAHICLKQYLTKYGHIILMQIINMHITIIRKTDSPQMDGEVPEEKTQRYEASINGHVEQPSGTGVDREMRELQEAIRLIQNNAHQPLRLFTVKNAIENASCGLIAPKMDKLAIGFSTAEIRLWGIGETVLVKKRNKQTCIPSACDISPFYKFNEQENTVTSEAGAIILRGHMDVVHDLRFIPEADILLSVSSDKDMRAWRLNDYSCAAIYSGHSYPIWCMDTSVFNLYIATGSHDRTAKLWSLDRTFPLRIFAGHFLDVNCIKFHPNARYIATGSADKTIRLWSKDDGNLLRVYVGAQSTIYTLAFSPDGKYLAAAGDDKSISIWDLASNDLLTELKGHKDTVMNVDWSLDGQYIASASLDGIVRLWPTQDFIKTLNGGSSNVMSQSEVPQIYSTCCSSILSLNYYKKNNSLICIGTK
ncbi:TAF5-like RNA polymerase II p300/CBP-associated factor-associated factor 65 kDa subunit 5L isoform X1 [Pogonomyrmex barbatus]|uniref:TAF5-like RNA polymerase II p300/CBP-associated factor-associated factor 65 kDa subunit 5L isoform X1 n=2 Tax=Pogonomyrmex barbatus TaxID=144034 RepID=A0A6I9VZN4_9HYME|nr:TAF5-like RNA polymerase II p300/CBP-associated factor-associated factor 65 kDa subunit 5L isoform X1 [Pogonomyrmex barbatus]